MSDAQVNSICAAVVFCVTFVSGMGEIMHPRTIRTNRSVLLYVQTLRGGD